VAAPYDYSSSGQAISNIDELALKSRFAQGRMAERKHQKCVIRPVGLVAASFSRRMRYLLGLVGHPKPWPVSLLVPSPKSRVRKDCCK